MACYLQLQQGGHLLLNATSGSLLLNVCNDVTASNWDVRPVHRQKTYETASEIVDRLVDSFTKPPVEQVTEAKEALRKLEALSLPELPKADFTLTYDQILEIQRIITEQIRLMYQQEEEEFLILAAQLLL